MAIKIAHITILTKFLLFHPVFPAEVYPPISDAELEKAANMANPIVRNEAVWNNFMDHNPKHINKHYRKDISRWANGILPYEITGSFTSSERANIAQAMNIINDNIPCVQIVPRSGEEDYVDIINNQDGCFADYGNRGGRHRLNLNRGIGCPSDVSVIIHEFLHSLGAIHEHNRPDRDDFVIIIWNDIMHDSLEQFWKSSFESESIILPQCNIDEGPIFDDCVSGHEIKHHTDLPYDLDSIMHYHSTVFSASDGPTIVALNGRTDFGQSAMMTELDIRKLRRAYGCDTAK